MLKNITRFNLFKLKNFNIKILQLVTERQYRGAQVFAAGLSGLLAEKGHEVIFAGIYTQKQNILSAKGSQNIDFGGKKISFDIFLFFRLLKYIKKIKPDIIQANGSDTLKYIAAIKLFLPHLNVVYRNISMVSAFASEGSWKRKINKQLFRKVDRVTSVGLESLNDLVNTYQFPIAKTKLIRRWIPYFKYDAADSRKKILDEFNFPATDLILVHVGKFSPEKNQQFLVEVFERIYPENKNTRLLLIGEGKDLGKIKNLVEKKKLSENILFTGHRENVQEIVAGCDLFVMGSKVEGVPGVIMEAAVQSLPSVAVSAGGINEVVFTGKTGILLDEYDIDEFSKAVVSLMGNQPLRKMLGANAKSFILENYTMENALKQFENIYNDILTEKKELAR